MKVELVHKFPELDLPLLYFFNILAIKLLGVVAVAHELESVGNTQLLLFAGDLGPEHLEDGLESDVETLAVLPVVGEVVEDYFLGQHQGHGSLVVLAQVESGAEDRVRTHELAVVVEDVALPVRIHGGY